MTAAVPIDLVVGGRLHPGAGVDGSRIYLLDVSEM